MDSKLCSPFPQFLHFKTKQKKMLLGRPAFLLKTTCARDTFIVWSELVWLSKILQFLLEVNQPGRRLSDLVYFNSSFYFV